MINASESHELIRKGIRFARDGAQSECMAAAEWWAIATESERPAVRAEFSEGVRNYCGNMTRYDDAMWEFDDWCVFYSQT